MTAARLPGVPMPSGFRPVTGERRKLAELSGEARARVDAKVESVRLARGRAEALAHTAVIG